MNIEQLSTMSEAELQARANSHLEHLDSETDSHPKMQQHVSQAQLYLAELDRRKQARERTESEKIAQRDYKLELWVIVLIGAELVLAIVAIVVGWIEGNKQMDVLDKLNQSSAATAATLTAVRQAQEGSLETQKHSLENITAMNAALQDEMDLNLTEAVQCSGGSFGGGHDEVNFTNEGRSILILWGSKFGDQPRAMRSQPKVLSPSSSVPFDLSRLVERTIKAMGTAPEVSIPFELYIKREDGTKYVTRGNLQVNQTNKAGPYIDRMITTRKQW